MNRGSKMASPNEAAILPTVRSLIAPCLYWGGVDSRNDATVTFGFTLGGERPTSVGSPTLPSSILLWVPAALNQRQTVDALTLLNQPVNAFGVY
jgi:hypothetical protein